MERESVCSVDTHSKRRNVREQVQVGRERVVGGYVGQGGGGGGVGVGWGV